MTKVRKSIVIDAPPEKIFSYVDRPANMPEFWTSFVEAKDIERLANGGTRFGWVYKMAGVRFEGTTITTEHVANQRLVTENKGGVSSIITWTFQPEYGGTKVTFEADYTVNLPLLRKLAESFIAKQNEREAEALLAKLKDKMEA